jgi:integrase
VSFWDETAGLLQEQWDVLAKTELALQTQVCARRAGARLVPDSLSKGFKALAESCGITGVRLHDLRHTHASILLCSGVPINVVQARMGHESIQTTIDCYGHLLPASDTQAGMVLEQYLGNWRLQNVSNNDHIPSSS